MTLADHQAFFADADSPLARLRTEPECPGQAGSSGVVFPATDTETGNRVALKLVRGRVAQDPDIVEAARANAIVQTRLDHPRVATLHESGHMPAGFYLLMDWLDGRPLTDVLQDGPMNPWAALTAAHDVASAVEAAYAAGIVHRDLTPAKVVVGGDGHGALGDLGAGRYRAGEPVPASSLDYVSPERLREEPLTPASHEYALACILFHCLTGEPPFARARASAKTFWHVRAPRPRVSERRADLPPELDQVIARAMSVDPDERHGGPEALVDAVGGVLGSLPDDPAELRATPRRARAGHVAPAPAATFDAWTIDDERPTAPEAPAFDPAAPAGRLNWMEDAPPPDRRIRVLGGAAAVVAGALLLAGGLIAGKQTKEPPAVAQASAVGTSELALVRPSGWEILDPGPTVPGLSDGDEVAVGPPGSAGAAVVAGMTTPGRDGLLPDPLLDRLPRMPGRGEPVMLGELEGFRFRNLEPEGPGGPITVYAVPTDEGTATLACVGGLEAAICDQQAATLQLTGPEPMPVRPAEDYAEFVADAFQTLNRRRAQALAALRSADTRTGQSGAANRLSGAYGTAAGRLRSAPGRRAVQIENAAIVAALEASAAAYRSMAYNAGRGDEGGYADARARAVAADRQVGRAVRRLEDAGYRIR